MVHFIACKDAETWCGFVKNSALCSTYEIGIKICPKSCQKCQGNFLWGIYYLMEHFLTIILLYFITSVGLTEMISYLDCEFIRRNNGCGLGKSITEKL